VRAWLRFGRAPVVDDGSIYDLRFAERIGLNFSRMELVPRRACPSNVPNWGMPRADLLGEAGLK
jgi:inner membrane protein